MVHLFQRRLSFLWPCFITFLLILRAASCQTPNNAFYPHVTKTLANFKKNHKISSIQWTNWLDHNIGVLPTVMYKLMLRLKAKSIAATCALDGSQPTLVMQFWSLCPLARWLGLGTWLLCPPASSHTWGRGWSSLAPARNRVTSPCSCVRKSQFGFRSVLL